MYVNVQAIFPAQQMESKHSYTLLQEERVHQVKENGHLEQLMDSHNSL